MVVQMMVAVIMVMIDGGGTKLEVMVMKVNGNVYGGDIG